MQKNSTIEQIPILYYHDEPVDSTLGAEHRMSLVDTKIKTPRIPIEIVNVILENPNSLYTPLPPSLQPAEKIEESITRRQLRSQERNIEKNNRHIRVLASNVLCRVLQKVGLGS